MSPADRLKQAAGHLGPHLSTSGRLQDKVVLITGGGAGIGETICNRFAQEGATVLVTDFDEAAAQKVASALKSQGYQAESIHHDVTKRADWDKVVQHIRKEHGGRIDVLVNNAGTAYPNQSSLTVAENDFDKVYTVNVKSIFHSVQTVFPLMIERKTGSVVSISSIAAIRPRGGLTWYNSSKAAVSNASKALAHEFGGRGIRCNCINPVLVPTQLASNFVPGFDGSPEQHKKAAQVLQIPLGRVTTKQDVANTALWLASDESSFVTGVDHHLDGGRSI